MPAVTLGKELPLPQPVVPALTTGDGDVKVPGPGLTICTNQEAPGGAATDGVIVKVHVYTFGAVWVQIFPAVDWGLPALPVLESVPVSRPTTTKEAIRNRIKRKRKRR